MSDDPHNDYYIRTPEATESRGPFDASKLHTLAESGQINENTLYFDEQTGEWIPIGANEELKARVFPQRDKLRLRLGKGGKNAAPAAGGEVGEDGTEAEVEEKRGVEIEEVLAAADGDTGDTRHLKKEQRSFERAAGVATVGLGLLFLLSGASLLVPHASILTRAFENENYYALLNHPFLVLGAFDVLMAVFLLLAVTEVYPVVRARAMLAVGFALYVGWALADPVFGGAAIAGGAGVFLATVTRRFTTMLFALVLGLAGNGFLLYLALTGRFKDFFNGASFGFFPGV